MLSKSWHVFVSFKDFRIESITDKNLADLLKQDRDGSESLSNRYPSMRGISIQACISHRITSYTQSTSVKELDETFLN